MSYSAILLVGGFGTRLHPITKSIPKPMLPVAGVPFIEHQIAKARDAGVSEIVLATSFKSEVFFPHFGNGEKFDISIKYAVEKVALGTGGAIKNASNYLSGCGPVVIFNGDVLSGHDLSAQITFHEERTADVTLYLTQVADARAYGAVELDSNNRVLAFNEKMENPPTNIINAGCYIFSRHIFDAIPANEVVSVERDIFPKILAQGSNVCGFVASSYWLDIGTPAALLQASRDLVMGEIASSATPPHRGQYLALEGAQVAETATVGSGSTIGRSSLIGDEVVLENCIVGNNATIGAKSVLHNCFIADNFNVPSGTIANMNFFGFN